MERSSEAAARIQQIEAQQDEMLRQLEDLERRTELALAEHAPRATAQIDAPPGDLAPESPEVSDAP